MTTAEQQGAPKKVVEEQLYPILASAVQNKASDLHLKIGKPPILRINGELRELGSPPLTTSALWAMVKWLCSASGQPEPTNQDKQLDFSLQITGTGRFRCHLYRQRGDWAAAIRIVPENIPSPKDLRLPAVVNQMVGYERGIILVSGATGMGKSTTIAALLAEMSAKRSLHILTIEDPIEFVIPDGRSTITQRSIGIDVNSFEDALEAAFREDPDVLFIGELRSAHAVEVALQAGESGHLCISTIHTRDVTSTVSRIAAMVKDEMRATVLARLSEALKAVISQRLIPLSGRGGRILAAEVMVVTPTLRQAIRDPDKHKTIASLIAKESTGTNSQTFDQHLLTLVRNKLITVETAEAAATSPTDFLRALRLG